MKLNFYRIFMYRNNQPTDYPIHSLIDCIMQFLPNIRYQIVNPYGRLSMLRMLTITNNNRTFWLGKYRDDKPYVGTEGTDDADPIEGDVFEPAIVHYDANLQLLVVQHNQIGPRKGSIQAYLNRFIQTNNTVDTWEIRLIPVSDDSALEKIRNARTISEVSIGVKNQNFNINHLLPERLEKQPILTCLRSVILAQVELGNLYNANISQICLKKGRFGGKGRGLNATEILDLVQVINDDDNESLHSFKIKITNQNGNKETIDAINIRNLSHEIPTLQNQHEFNEIASYVLNEYNSYINFMRNRINLQHYHILPHGLGNQLSDILQNFTNIEEVQNE